MGQVSRAPGRLNIADMPRVFHYVHRTCGRYDELRPLQALLDSLAGACMAPAISF